MDGMVLRGAVDEVGRMEGISHREEASVHGSHIEESRSKYMVLGYGLHILYTGGTQVSA